MDTQFAVSDDGTRIAYDISGRGPALILLHGAGQSRKNWHSTGHVERLARDYRVVAIDLRGMGESDIRTEEEDFSIQNLQADICAVADACGLDDFYLWGYSFGGNIARHIACSCDRVSGLVVMGSPLSITQT